MSLKFNIYEGGFLMYYNYPYLHSMEDDNLYTCNQYKPQPDDMCTSMPQETMPIHMAKLMNKEKKCVKVDEVIGTNTGDALIECEIPFPASCPALEMKDVIKHVTDLCITVCKNKVLCSGKCHLNVNYKTYEASGKGKLDCSDIELSYGSVRHVAALIPFKCVIDLPGARPGDAYEVVDAYVEEDCTVQMLKDATFMKESCMQVYKSIDIKVLCCVEVKVLRPCQIIIDPEKNGPCCR